MVNYRGRCYNLLLSKVADVIAIMLCVADGKPNKFHVTTLLILMADVIAKVAGGIATKGQFYFNLGSEVLNRTPFHMCGRWYLPMVLLRDGLFTLCIMLL